MWREHDGRWQDTSPVVLRWMDCGVGVFLWWECFYGSVQGFGNESTVLDEGVVAERLWPAGPEFYKCQRDPVVAFLDDASFPEDRLVQDNVMRVGVVRHDALPSVVSATVG